MTINAYRYDEIQTGMSESFSVTITAQMQKLFFTISGDSNPLHSDRDHAKEQGFQQPLVYGMLTASFYSTLVGTYLPGRFCLFQEADIKFTKPVFVGDSLVISGSVTEKNDLFKRLSIKAGITNQHGQVVSRAKLKVGVLDD